jgi:hypothetical protein
MEGQRVNSGGDSPFSGLRTSSGQFSNNQYVGKLIRDKLAEYELQLSSMRQGNAVGESNQSQGETVTKASREFSTEDKKILSDFLELKIENLRNLLAGMENGGTGNVPPIL